MSKQHDQFISDTNADYLNARIAELETDAARADIDNQIAADKDADRIAELEAIVDKLPKTADGMPITPAMRVYRADGVWATVLSVRLTVFLVSRPNSEVWADAADRKWFSTYKAALAANGGE